MQRASLGHHHHQQEEEGEEEQGDGDDGGADGQVVVVNRPRFRQHFNPDHHNFQLHRHIFLGGA